MEGSLLINCLAVLSLLIVLLLLKRIVGIFPSVVGCLIRWKESVNLEASVKLSRDRDVTALALVIPFCLTACSFRLYDPGFMEGLAEEIRLGITAAVFVTYVLFRLLTARLFRPQKMSKATYGTAHKASCTFFILLTLLLLATGGLMSIIGVAQDVTRCAMLWISAGIYAMFLLRKTQIFASSCSVFTAFLYLCALEIIPTGTLVVSAMIF
ncbi:MAG: DUF4271 domain-containing protein [Bacteroidales bacterium]|nr:DUF4271 domain-containing protein [Bacteroidales bacterium]MBQ8422620.1 DUF4271 domain-containing protein [Bacteroidales bacterium]